MDNLATVLRVRYARPDSVGVSFNEGSELTFEFFLGENPIESKTYRAEDGLSITSDGKIQLYALLVTRSGRVGGVFLIVIPMVEYRNHLAIFPRRK